MCDEEFPIYANCKNLSLSATSWRSKVKYFYNAGLLGNSSFVDELLRTSKNDNEADKDLTQISFSAHNRN